jgi:GTP pyrophosphokinase
MERPTPEDLPPEGGRLDHIDDHERVLANLSELCIVLPEDNIKVKADQHDITIENYCKYALSVAEKSDYLKLHLEGMLALEELAEQTAKDVFVMWAPVAEIMGWYDIKVGLEQAAFNRLYPEEKQAIAETYQHLGGDEEMEAMMSSYISGLESIFEEILEGSGIQVQIKGRRKSDYSVWRKVTKKVQNHYELSDYFGIRIVVDSRDGEEIEAVKACYIASDVLSQCFEPDTKRFKNYIANPKPNGYQSIHLTLKDINGAPLECQVRTARMDDVAENDPNTSHLIFDATKKVAAGKSLQVNEAKSDKIYRWREAAAEEIRQRQSRGEHSLTGLQPEKKLLFTDDGNAYELDSNATVLDLSFAVHGAHALKTKQISTRGISVKFKYQPAHGEVFHVTYHSRDQATWNDGWLRNVTSKKAQDNLRRAQLRRDHAEFIRIGTKKVVGYFGTKGLEDPLAYLTESDKESIAQSYGYKDFEALLVNIGTTPILNIKQPVAGMGRIEQAVRENLDALSGLAKEARKKRRTRDEVEAEHLKDGHAVSILGTLDCSYSFASCCASIMPSEDAVALISKQRGNFSVHRTACDNTNLARVKFPCSWYARSSDSS